MRTHANRLEQRGSGPWPGRLLLWPGGGLYLGRLGDTELHSHHAMQFCVGLDGEFRFRSRRCDPWRSTEGVVLPPHAPHQLDGRGSSAALLYLDPSTASGRRIAAYFGRPMEGTSESLSTVRESLSQWQTKGRPANELSALCRVWVSSVIGPAAFQESVERRDPRVARLLELLNDPVWWNRAVPELASSIGLSQGRMRTLFREQVGLSPRRYVLWRRLLAAISEITDGYSLTRAAHDAEFADSAHLTRTFRRMFGIRPSALARHSRFVQVLRDVEI